MWCSSRRAFTLIELLVVIAIIAILAAILFPVFAQAREKARQTVCISNYKQDSLAMLQYVQDYDELFPQGQLQEGGIDYAVNEIYTTPPNGRPGNVELRSQEWLSAIDPYAKNYQIADCPSVSGITVATNWTITPPRISEVFNGEIQRYPLAGLVEPSEVILLWPGMVKNGYLGFAFTSPALNCPNATQSCTYVGGGACNASGVASTANGVTSYPIVFGGWNSYSKWVHGNGDNTAYSDGHVKWHPNMGNGNYDPWVYGNTDGNIVVNGYYSWWYDGCHAWPFEPDVQF
jgi:prepilin-type N-terminal cleavage/methylation domain-containing protein